MKKQILFLFCLGVMLGNSIPGLAQLVGTNFFLQGRYLEIGQLNNGSFGACTSIAGYHPHSPGAAIGSALAEVYDYGKDGWAVGTPPFMGDYTYPGSPFEGWGLQIGTTRTHARQQCPAGTYVNGGVGIGLTGANTTYTNAGGSVRGMWIGSASGGTVQIRQETRVDTLSSAVVVTTVIRNTAAVATAPMYYMRSCDPDNDQTWPGGGFFTNNTIVHQNEDARHRVLVSSRGAGYPAAAYMGLGTKDCRARCCIYNAWPLAATVDFATVWNSTYTTATYGLGQTSNGDIAIALTYNLGSIAAGDSTILSYAYIFDGNLGLDSAFPDPQIVVNGVPKVSFASPTPNFDTFDVCLYPGMTSLPVSILNAVDKNWSWSKWTWSPGLGLASTTGVNNTISTTALPPYITYTITGTDSATGMFSCHNKTFYLTILTCNGAIVNSPCVGDTLWFNAPGDSTGATYQWYGPAPSTTVFSTTQRTFLYPATSAMNGVYSVIKTVAGVPDTSITTAFIRHKPTVTASSNSPLCIGAANTLLLTATVDSPVTAYSWSATPPTFTSTLSNPTIPGFSIADTGVYTVIATTSYGCKDTASVRVSLIPPPPPPVIIAQRSYCQFATFVPFTFVGMAPGGTVLWYTAGTGGTGSTVAPTVNTSIVGSNTFYFSQIVGSCESLRDSVTIVVNITPVSNFTFERFPGCPVDSVAFTQTSTSASTFEWAFGDGVISYDPNPSHIYDAGHIVYNVRLTVRTAAGCTNDITKPVNLTHDVTANFNFADLVVCNQTGVVINDLSTSFKYTPTPTIPPMIYEWNYGDGTIVTTNGSPAPYTYATEGIYSVTLTVTDSLNCVDEITKVVTVIQPYIDAVGDSTFCLTTPMPLFNEVYTRPVELPYGFTYQWTPAANLSSDTAKVPMFDGLGVFVYTLTATMNTEGCVATHVMTLSSTLPKQLQNITASTTIMFGNSVQLYADSVMFYTWTPNDGSLNNPNINNPIATPSVTTTYTVYGMDYFGCRDTATVTVRVDTSMSEFVPSGFTPNGDGLNDVFRLNGSKFQHMLELRIFNRWGEQVFYSTTREQGWDGSYKGVPQDLGVYYYTVIVARPGHPTNQVYKGEVTLIR